MCRKLLSNESGAAGIVGLYLSLILILYFAYSGIMISHQGDVKVTVEAAARAAARDYAEHQDLAHAQTLAYETVSGSLPVNAGQYSQAADCQINVITVNGTQYAQAVVDYRYPVLIPDLPELLNGTAGPLPGSVTIYGTAAFVLAS